MGERAFVIQQIGVKDSPVRRRADEIYEDIIVPAVQEVSLEPYRADRDLTPGAITPKILEELLKARVVIADLTGRNPNVFYELGITHSFARPLISIADSSESLPFDAKDERVIPLGKYPPGGLGHRQVKSAINSLRDSLGIVLGNDYSPPSPLRDVATIRSIDQLAPEDPHAAEMAQIREALEEIRKKVTPSLFVPRFVGNDIAALRHVIKTNIGLLDVSDFEQMMAENTSTEQKLWAQGLYEEWLQSMQRAENAGPDLTDDERYGALLRRAAVLSQCFR
jgi:hypothetical protein